MKKIQLKKQAVRSRPKPPGDIASGLPQPWWGCAYEETDRLMCPSKVLFRCSHTHDLDMNLMSATEVVQFLLKHNE